MAGPWVGFDCSGSTGRWRHLDDGTIELDGVGVPEAEWPSEVYQWRTLINEVAASVGVEPHQLAAIMAMESGGRPGLCLKCKGSGSGCDHDGECNHREGMGLMAVTLRTAKHMNGGVAVTEAALRYDNELNVLLAAKYLKYQMDRYGGDFVRAAVAYNAGSVKCGRGKTFSSPKETCPKDMFGVVQGCVRRSSPASNLVCEPSVAVPGMFNCTVNYPLKAIGLNNAAAIRFGVAGGGRLPGPLPGPGLEPAQPVSTAETDYRALAFGAGMALGFFVVFKSGKRDQWQLSGT